MGRLSDCFHAEILSCFFISLFGWRELRALTCDDCSKMLTGFSWGNFATEGPGVGNPLLGTIPTLEGNYLNFFDVKREVLDEGFPSWF